jgi:alpha-tubulin suppressor-like RCC1 family protein
LALAVSAVQGPVAFASKAPKPAIKGLKASSASVPSGGTVVVSGSVTGASSCRLSSKRPVPGLPESFSCSSGSIDQEVAMPQNAGKKAVSYVLTVVASGPTRSSKSVVRVSVKSAPQLSTATSISVGFYDACAVLSTGHVQCWGNNLYGQTGDGTDGWAHQDVPVEVLNIADAKEVTVGFAHACALLTTGHVECWGFDEAGTLGDGNLVGPDVCMTEKRCSLAAVEVQGVTDAVQIGGSPTDPLLGGGSCVLLSTGRVECWGPNGAGDLGTGSAPPALYHSNVPLEVAGIGDAVQLSSNSPCVVLSTGHVECWGFGAAGELGDGYVGHDVPGPEQVHSSDVPVEASGITDAVQVNGACAVLANGHLDCWGRNRSGELGDGTTTGPEVCSDPGEMACSTVPVEASGVTGVSQVARGWEHTCALSTGGDVECWGSNWYGQLGNGEEEPNRQDLSLTPVHVIEITHATQIATNGDSTCALLAEGRVKCWGDGSDGQLGFGKLSPAQEEDFTTATPFEVAGL